MNIELLQHNNNALHSINDNVKDLLRNFSVGFEDYLSSPMLSFHKDNATTFPFHDISKDGDEGYILEIALAGYSRSEEHTSELQSRLHLVCRLLLEKKKKQKKIKKKTKKIKI